MAIVRQHLYDIDLVISRTVAYGTLTAVLGATYAASSSPSARSSPRRSLLRRGRSSVAVAFRPVRTRIQNVVDRRFRRARYESRRVMTEFVDRLRRGEVGATGWKTRCAQPCDDDELAIGFRSRARRTT